MKAREVAEFIEDLAPESTCIQGDEYGLLIGDPDSEVTGIGVAWWATGPVIEQAARDGVNTLLVHEGLFTHEQRSPWYDEAPLWSKPVNSRRMKALLDGGFAVFRYHSAWDALEGHGVPDSFGRELGFDEYVARGKYTRTYRIAPTTLRGYGEDVAKRLTDVPVRVFGDPDRRIEHVGIMIGGFGGNQPNMPEELLAQGADVVVMGDMCEHTLLNALESGLAVVEALHSVSEEPAMREMARLIRERFAGTDVHYYPSGGHTYGAFVV